MCGVDRYGAGGHLHRLAGRNDQVSITLSYLVHILLSMFIHTHTHTHQRCERNNINYVIRISINVMTYSLVSDVKSQNALWRKTYRRK